MRDNTWDRILALSNTLPIRYFLPLRRLSTTCMVASGAVQMPLYVSLTFWTSKEISVISGLKGLMITELVKSRLLYNRQYSLLWWLVPEAEIWGVYLSKNFRWLGHMVSEARGLVFTQGRVCVALCCTHLQSVFFVLSRTWSHTRSGCREIGNRELCSVTPQHI